MKNNFFIVIEGIDASGKTGLIELLKSQLELEQNSSIKNYFGEKIYFTSEPYGPNKETKYSQLSSLIFSNCFSSVSEAFLFLAMRSDHLFNFIIPKLQENSLIFCDRYYLSTLAYQAYLKKVELDLLDSNMKYISKGTKPLVTFVLQISKEEHSKHKSHKREDNKYDSVNSFSYDSLVSAYDWAIQHLRESGEEIVLIPSSLSWEEKAQLVISYIERLIAK
ncbi:thymidylate kinase [Mycoplasma wenyonii str. Massachusetts]|uniref:Thymidylate kinase n=1 Tax=Mycoplasma wenyonii (strain Massachusetts) TaxID=1197325 RepID=I6YBM5_MYCWM|nr:dTMP kinase [Mycoplasma wenyonii]AFN65411.1 thymidylate kinase [Mycoplasma wenyonii str. Massachusetts]